MRNERERFFGNDVDGSAPGVVARQTKLGSPYRPLKARTLRKPGHHGNNFENIKSALVPRPIYGRAVLTYGLVRFAWTSAWNGHWDFVGSALHSLGALVIRTGADAFLREKFVECNLCGWSGRLFYPNTGPGYNEPRSMCPGCLASDRYRSLFELLRLQTSAFEPGSRVVEVAPLRSLEKIFLSQPQLDYTSFDIERHAMERGDVTSMRYGDDSVDWFICYHVLEHIPDEKAALSEIHRVLRPGGSALFQVPIDWAAPATREYPAPDPRDVGHVRRHGRDFGKRIADRGFEVVQVELGELLGAALVAKGGLSSEPIFMAKAIK